MSRRVPAWAVLVLAVAIYALGLALYPTGVALVQDESDYVRQAVAFAHGHVMVSKLDVERGERVWRPASGYPIGTSLLQAGFVWLGGWQLAVWASCLSLAVLVWSTAALLRQEGQSPLFALLVLAFPATLVLGRMAMSDVPSAALCALGLVLFFRGIGGHWSQWFGAGVVAGGSVLFRDTNPLLFVPLFAGTVLRGERKALALIAGGLAGLSLRVISSLLLYGEPWMTRWIFGFGIEPLLRNLPYYALILTVLVPAGLPAALVYRGRRWPEVVVTVILFLAFFSAYEYSALESGEMKRLILGPRYLVPLLPLLALCVAHGWSRLHNRGPRGALRLAQAAAGIWTVGVLIAAFAVHPSLRRWGRTQEAIRLAIYEVTSDGSLIVTDNLATEKSINEIYGERLLASRRNISPGRAIELRELASEMFLVFLERSDSDFWRKAALDDQAFVAELQRRCELTKLHDRSYTITDRLLIWRVDRCDGSPSAPAPLLLEREGQWKGHTAPIRATWAPASKSARGSRMGACGAPIASASLHAPCRSLRVAHDIPAPTRVGAALPSRAARHHSETVGPVLA